MHAAHIFAIAGGMIEEAALNVRWRRVSFLSFSLPLNVSGLCSIVVQCEEGRIIVKDALFQ
jgi:hypothetical protein